MLSPMRGRLVLSFLLAACGSHRAAPTPSAPVADGASLGTASPTCVTAREARTKAAELDRGGHALLALAKLDEANAACGAERALSLALEAAALASTGNCARVRALEGAPEAKAACAALEAPPKGTEATMRAKMREAWAAERAKDFAKAQGLYLDAWAEQHPNARALEAAARAASLAGDAAQGRRLRDRTLVETEATEHASAELSSRVRVVRGAARLSGDTLTLGWQGQVVARDLKTGELRVLLDATGGATRLSSYGTLAFVLPAHDTTPVSVYDLLTGKLLFKASQAAHAAASPDDALVAVQAAIDAPQGQARILDATTGQEKTRLSGRWRSIGTDVFAFSPDASHVVAFDDHDAVYRQWDLDKGSPTSVLLPSKWGVAAASPDGHFFVWVEGPGETSPLHVRDMVANKETARWTSRFVSVEALAVSNDGKTVATGSYGSLRLWDVAEKKQIFKESTYKASGWSTDSRDRDAFAFSDDGKTMVLAGNGLATGWDVATGKETPLVPDQPDKTVLRVVRMPGDAGVALVLEDEVRIVPATGEPHAVCRGMKPAYFPIIGPTSVAFSASGRSLACAMADGWIHVFDASTWTERAVVKKGPKASGVNPVDLAFSADEKALVVVTDTSIVVYDAQTGAQSSKVALKHPRVGLMARHARFSDGRIAVRTLGAAAAIFGADGAYERDVPLVAGAPAGAQDDFSADGTAYAVALQKTLHLVDLAKGATRTVALPQLAKSVALSADGKSVAVVGKDGTVYSLAGDEVHPVPHLSRSALAWPKGSSVVAANKATIEAVPAAGGDVTTLEVGADGVVVRDAAGGFELRGKPELQCVVGKTYLSRETCADRAKDGLMASWLAKQ